ncbi:MAG: type I restriction-modification system subunit M N-terminal domain-containing protein, partial [Pyramidobacter sp.]|nr:type I restriction-modification system subunit M N-terminal domain-containing protein [Pyramidobacter sp.]
MNKQQLASKIWNAANKMRSKIEANEYKDYILGFIFYKFLSDKEVEYAKQLGYADEDLESALTEDDPEIVESFQKNIGYFIAYQNLFSTWIAQGADFDSGSVPDALNAFTRNIS